MKNSSKYQHILFIYINIIVFLCTQDFRVCVCVSEDTDHFSELITPQVQTFQLHQFMHASRKTHTNTHTLTNNSVIKFIIFKPSLYTSLNQCNMYTAVNSRGVTQSQKSVKNDYN